MVSNIKSGYEAVTGKDIYGNKLSKTDRAIAATGVFFPGAKHVKRGAKIADKGFDLVKGTKKNKGVKREGCACPKGPKKPVEKGVNWKSTKKFGHTFSRHGAGDKNTNRLRGRAASTNQEQGQWLDNQKAAEFLDSLGEVKEVTEVNLPKGLGQIITPSGEIVEATKIRVVPSPTGIKTAFPIR